MARRAVLPDELLRGPFTVEEALRAGLTPKQLRGASWRRVGRCTYVWAGLPDDPGHGLAAVNRRMPEGAAFSGRTAGWLHGLDLPAAEPVEITIPAVAAVTAVAGAAVRRAELDPGDVVRRSGMPVTSALRTVLDLGRWLPLAEAVVVADMALQKRLVDLAELRARVADHPRCRGIGQLRRVVDLAQPAAATDWSRTTAARTAWPAPAIGCSDSRPRTCSGHPTGSSARSGRRSAHP